MREQEFAIQQGATCSPIMHWGAERTTPICLTCLASPCRAGDSRSRPQAGEAGARNAPALTGWRRSGPMATSRWGHWSHSQPQPSRPCERPFDSAAGHGADAGDVLPDALVEHGLPRHEAEPRPHRRSLSIMANRPLDSWVEPTSWPLTCAAGHDGPPLQSAFGGERLAGSFDVGRLKPAGSDPWAHGRGRRRDR